MLDNGIVIEAKGRLTRADRQKYIWVKEQYPKMDLRFVFQNPNNRIYKGSKTTYAKWAKKNGFKYAKGLIPESWIAEDGVYFK